MNLTDADRASAAAGSEGAVRGELSEVLAELKAIRALLEQQGVCPHGNTGICMYCIQPTFDAMEMAVRRAVGSR